MKYGGSPLSIETAVIPGVELAQAGYLREADVGRRRMGTKELPARPEHIHEIRTQHGRAS